MEPKYLFNFGYPCFVLIHEIYRILKFLKNIGECLARVKPKIINCGIKN